jgi:aminopeptidase N
MQFSFRITMRAGFGEHPSETALYLYGDNPEGMTTSRLTRSRMSMQTQELRFSNRLLPFHQGGGLNVRGYTGYAFGRDDGIYFGKSGGAVNAEWDFGDIFAPRSAFLKKYFHTDLYAFFDAAKIFRGEKEQFAADAGVGIAFHFKLYEEDDSPFIFRIDAPFWLSDAYPDGKNWRFRYVFGVGRAF